MKIQEQAQVSASISTAFNREQREIFNHYLPTEAENKEAEEST
jgi:hypothetical protein